jgi:hypothetical protein
MKKIAYVLAILAAASTAAVAKDLKQDKKATAAPALSATQMTDSEMDNVTAAGHPTLLGEGNDTALKAGGTSLFPGEVNNNSHSSRLNFIPGTGVCTTGASGHC